MTNETDDFPILSTEAAGSLSLADVPVVTGRASTVAAHGDYGTDNGDVEENMETVDMQQVSLEDQGQAVPFEGASLPNPEDMPSSPRASSSTRKRFYFRCFSATACLLVTFFIIFAVGLSVRPADDSSGSASARPTREQVVAFLVQHNVSTSAQLNDSTSLQYVAAQHLAELDQREVPLPVAIANDHYDRDVYMYTVRYVMVLLYMAWKGPHWRTQHDFMTPLDVCQWNAVSFSFDTPTMLEPGGVICDPVSGLPIKLDLGACLVCACVLVALFSFDPAS